MFPGMPLNKQWKLYCILPHLCFTWLLNISDSMAFLKNPYLLNTQAVPHAGQVDVPLCHCVEVPGGVVCLVAGKRIVSWTSRHSCVIFF